MPISPVAFSKTVYYGRIAKTRAAMEAKGIDVLFATHSSNQTLLSGYDWSSFYVHEGVIKSHTNYPTGWGCLQDAAGAPRTVWMGCDQILGYSEHLVQKPHLYPIEHLVQLLIDMDN